MTRHTPILFFILLVLVLDLEHCIISVKTHSTVRYRVLEPAECSNQLVILPARGIIAVDYMGSQ